MRRSSLSSKEDASVKTAVVIGGGFAGLCAIRAMRGTRRLRIVLIDERPQFVYSPALWEFDHFPEPEERIGIDLKEYAHRHHVEFIQDTVERIDAAKRTIVCGKQHLSYDYLLICPGAKTNFYAIPGLEQHAFQLKGFPDVRRLREAITGLVNHYQDRAPGTAEAKGTAKDIIGDKKNGTGGDAATAASSASRPLNIVVGGGGLAGIDTAMGAHDYITFLTHKRTISPGFTITIIEAGPSILAGFPHKAIARVQKGLEKRGLTIKAGTRITGVDRTASSSEQAGALAVKTSDGATIVADLLIWTGGVLPSSCVLDSGLTITPRNCVVTDDHLRAAGREDVFAAGDSAQVNSRRGDKPLPMNAHWAMTEGGHAGRNIALLSKGARLKPFVPGKDAPVIVGLGGHDAVFFWNDLVFEGYLAEIMRRSIRMFVLRYLR